MTAPTDRLTNAEIAELLGIKPDTWRGMIKGGQAPPAEEPYGGREPISRYRWYYRAAVEHFAANRAGRGHRTDLMRNRAGACVICRLPAGQCSFLSARVEAS